MYHHLNGKFCKNYIKYTKNHRLEKKGEGARHRGALPPRIFQDYAVLVLLAPTRLKNQVCLGLFKVLDLPWKFESYPDTDNLGTGWPGPP